MKKKSNENFRAQSDPEHYIIVTLLLNIIPESDMIKIFVLDVRIYLCHEKIISRLLDGG